MLPWELKIISIFIILDTYYYIDIDKISIHCIIIKIIRFETTHNLGVHNL